MPGRNRRSVVFTLGELLVVIAIINDGGPTFGAFTSRSYHPGGVNAGFADGSVRFIKSTVNGYTRRALGTVQGGEIISADAY